MLQMGNAQVRHVLRVVQVEDLHVLQRGQMLQTQVRDLRVGQVDALQLRQTRQRFQVGIRQPGVAQIDADDLAGGIASSSDAPSAIESGLGRRRASATRSGGKNTRASSTDHSST